MSTPYSPDDGDRTWSRHTRSKFRAVPKGLALATAAAILASCTQDQAVARRSLVAPVGPSPVVALPNEYNLIDNATLTVNGAIWNQSKPFGVGTGNLNPFLRFQAPGSTTIEEAFNSDAKPAAYNADFSWTKSLPLNEVPVIKKSSVAYREFILDANESNSAPDAFYSIDFFNVWLCNDPAVVDYTDRAQISGNSKCKSVYTYEAGKLALATDALSSGSGNGYDYQILIPNQKFIDAANLIAGFSLADCDYDGGSGQPCGAFIIVDTHMGGKGGDYGMGATFEEFSTVKRPWVKVTKTAVPSFKRRYLWKIEKSVDPTDITLFDGQSADATWKVKVTPQDPAFVDFEAVVTGTITVQNTSGAAVTLGSITDAIGDGYPAPTLTCPSGTTNVPLANGASYVCTYSVTPPNTLPAGHTNTATVTVVSGVEGEDPAEFKGTAIFNFANASPSLEVDKNPPVYDAYNGAAETLLGNASTGSFEYKKTYTCNKDAGHYSNTARIDLADPTTDPTASASLDVHCLGLTVTKTAGTTVNRTFKWKIAKSVTPANWTLLNGDKGTSDYTVTLTPDGFTDAGLTVTGDITIHNPNSVPVYITALPTDAMDNGVGSATVTCPKVGAPTVFQFTLAAGADLVCSYTKVLPAGFSTATNTATVNAKPTLSGTAKNFTGTASVSAAAAVPTETNKVVNVTDSFDGGAAVDLGTATWGTGTTPGDPTVKHPASRDFPCPTAKASFTNTATIKETGQTAQATVNVTCKELEVTKTANAQFSRKWTWAVDKSADAGPDLNLALGESFIVNYSVQYTKSGPTDFDFKITAGTIKIKNPAGAATSAAKINSVSDVLSVAGTAVVNCPGTAPYIIAASAELNCTYTVADLGSKGAQKNTATAVKQHRAWSSALAASDIAGSTADKQGTADVVFPAAPAVALDECADVADTYFGSSVTGNICGSKTFTYARTLKYDVCGQYTVPNEASFTTKLGATQSGTSSNIVTPLTGKDPVTLNVVVKCPEGCTLTLGYWKTHNASFRGGAPLDDNWDNVTPAKEKSGFFTVANSFPVVGPNKEPFSWFDVFWTAPKGNAYYILSHQWMAAKLNYLNGAGQLGSVTSALGDAQTFFATAGNTPTGWTKGSTTKDQLIAWAGILGSYNEGTIGPGHCSEDKTSAP